ncbi:energy-coupling factor transporter transmembrane protein EcfT [Clostridia bacterium]|nr:energy-coupling factor transporter transmembrane protein EcfT [Clostridia bacterium]
MGIKDITFGQYYPGESVIHRMDSRFKVVIDIFFAVMLFAANNFYSLAAVSLFVLIVFALSGLRITLILKSIKPILPLIIFTAVLNLLFMNGENLVLDLKFTQIYEESIRITIFMLVRIVVLIIAMSLLTYTTSPIELTDALESLLSPLKKFRFPVHELSMMMTIALRFIPTLIEETNKIMSAQKARGANLDTGGLLKKAKALVPILIPLFIAAFRRANELATAMECRCYRGGEGRTRLKVLRISGRDIVAAVIVGIAFGGVIAGNFLLINVPCNFTI